MRRARRARPTAVAPIARVSGPKMADVENRLRRHAGERGPRQVWVVDSHGLDERGPDRVAGVAGKVAVSAEPPIMLGPRRSIVEEGLPFFAGPLQPVPPP